MQLIVPHFNSLGNIVLMVFERTLLYFIGQKCFIYGIALHEGLSNLFKKVGASDQYTY